MGVDTVKLSYSLQSTKKGWEWVNELGTGWRRGKNYGTMGPLWWTERVHDDGTRVVVKGIGADAHLLWEGSVPKYLGLMGAAQPDDVRLIDRHLRRIVMPDLPAPYIRRLDLTVDVHDPKAELLDAARDWKPHARARYVEACYLNPADGGRTVWQHNKTRGVRVYEKFPESGFQEWARDLTRVEYQVRGEWCEKLGLDRLYRDLGRNVDDAIRPLVAELEMRAGL